jgi:hypothetical protein
VTTPREQLIQAIDKAIDDSALRYDGPPDAREFLRALSDLGAVVLMPVNETWNVYGPAALWKPAMTIAPGIRYTIWPVDGLYMNALEGEQS